MLCCVCAAVDFSQGPKFYSERWCQNKLTAKMPFFLSGKLKRNVRMRCFQHDFCLILFAFQLFNLLFFLLQFCCLHTASGYLNPCTRKLPKAGLQFDLQLWKRQTVFCTSTENWTLRLCWPPPEACFWWTSKLPFLCFIFNILYVWLVQLFSSQKYFSKALVRLFIRWKCVVLVFIRLSKTVFHEM